MTDGYRVIKVGIEVDGNIVEYTSSMITVTGTKYASSTKDECTITIENVKKDVSDYLITNTSPFVKQPKRCGVYVLVGRTNWGITEFYTGDIVGSYISGLPDKTLTLKCKTGGFQRGKIINRAADGVQKLSTIAQAVAQDNDLTLNMKVPDKNISGYSFRGASINQIQKLEEISDCQCFVDGKDLVMKKHDQGRTEDVRVLNTDDIINQIEPNEYGIKLSMLFDQVTNIGSRVQVNSSVSAAFNGEWIVYKLGFNLTNHDTPFYLIPEMNRSGHVPESKSKSKSS